MIQHVVGFTQISTSLCIPNHKLCIRMNQKVFYEREERPASRRDEHAGWYYILLVVVFPTNHKHRSTCTYSLITAFVITVEVV